MENVYNERIGLVVYMISCATPLLIEWCLRIYSADGKVRGEHESHELCPFRVIIYPGSTRAIRHVSRKAYYIIVSARPRWGPGQVQTMIDAHFFLPCHA